MTEQLQRAFVVLSFLVHYYVWCEDGAAEQVLPRTIAAPYWHVAKALGCEPFTLTQSSCGIWLELAATARPTQT